MEQISVYIIVNIIDIFFVYLKVNEADLLYNRVIFNELFPLKNNTIFILKFLYNQPYTLLYLKYFHNRT